VAVGIRSGGRWHGDAAQCQQAAQATRWLAVALGPNLGWVGRDRGLPLSPPPIPPGCRWPRMQACEQRPSGRWPACCCCVGRCPPPMMFVGSPLPHHSCVIDYSSDLLRHLHPAPASMKVLVHGPGRNSDTATTCDVNADTQGCRYILGGIDMTLTRPPLRAPGETLGPSFWIEQRWHLSAVPPLKMFLWLRTSGVQ
jgi:hypothetical protein